MKNLSSHLLALFSIFIWGTTFVASKQLLLIISTPKLIFLRFLIAYIVVFALNHRQFKIAVKDEIGMILFAFFTVTVYNLLETAALNYTYAANVSIIVTLAPVITALLAHLFAKDEKISKYIVIGSMVAFSGVILVVFNGSIVFKLNPIGDLFAFLAAICWGAYSICLKIFINKYDEAMVTRKLIFYCMLTTLPFALMDNGTWNINQLIQPLSLSLLAFLGILGSGLSYITWNIANARLGIVIASLYVYVIPFITLIAGYVFLNEPITIMSVLGSILIISGVMISEKNE